MGCLLLLAPDTRQPGTGCHHREVSCSPDPRLEPCPVRLPLLFIFHFLSSLGQCRNSISRFGISRQEQCPCFALPTPTGKMAPASFSIPHSLDLSGTRPGLSTRGRQAGCGAPRRFRAGGGRSPRFFSERARMSPHSSLGWNGS